MNKKTIKEKQNRFLEAKKSYQEIQREIKPFIKQRKVKAYSTAGEWRKETDSQAVSL